MLPFSCLVFLQLLRHKILLRYFSFSGIGLFFVPVVYLDSVAYGPHAGFGSHLEGVGFANYNRHRCDVRLYLTVRHDQLDRAGNK